MPTQASCWDEVPHEAVLAWQIGYLAVPSTALQWITELFNGAVGPAMSFVGYFCGVCLAGQPKRIQFPHLDFTSPPPSSEDPYLDVVLNCPL